MAAAIFNTASRPGASSQAHAHTIEEQLFLPNDIPLENIQQD